MSMQAKTFIATLRKAIAWVAAPGTDERGVSSIEFSFFVAVLALGLLNTVDVATYLYQRMELENATQMAAQAAWQACNINSLPATTNCSGLTTAVTNALHSTSLGTKVALQSGYPSEGYYCLNATGALQYVSGVSQRPTDCTATGMPSLQPTDYIKIMATFSYTPMFSDLTVASLLTTPITDTAWMRLD
jgi:Flp pilus assembly protein TadG